MKIRNTKSILKSWQQIACGIIMAAGVMAAFAPAPHAYAGGGVGSGGSGSGGSGAGHYTYYGWGWADYNVSDSGPADNMRNGSTWAAAQTNCRNAGATHIYAFIIYDSTDQGMVYDYQNVYDSPSTYRAHFATGQAVQGGGVAMASSTARNAFNNLGTYKVSTTGYSFGTNVAWFCYNYQTWKLAPSISASDTSPNPGQVETWTYSVKNNGPSAATFSWNLQHKNPGGAYGIVSGQTGTSTNLARGSSSPSLRKWSLTIPGTAKNGDVYCARIVASDGSGPNTADINAASCVTVVLPAKPKGDIVITCNNTGTLASGVASFSDADGSATYPLKATLTSGISSISKTVNASSGSVTLSSVAVPMTKTVSFTLTVPDVGPAASASNNFTLTKTKTCTTPGVPCPIGNQNTKPTVSVPQAPQPVHNGATVSSAAPSGYQSDAGAVWYQETPQNSYRIDDAYDQWGSGSAPTSTAPSAPYPAGTPSQVGATHVTWTAAGFVATNTFTLDYQNYVAQYPYDLHNTTVLYTQQYKEQAYVANTAAPNYGCPNYGATYSSTNGKCNYWASPNCTDGTAPHWVTGTGWRCTKADGSDVGFYCPDGSSPDAGHACHYAPAVTYPWKASGGLNTVNSQSATGAQQLDQCYYRSIDLDDSQSKAEVLQTLPDAEDPNTVAFRGTITGIYSRDPAESTSNARPRQANSSYVNVTVSTFYSRNANALSGTALPGCSISQADISLGKDFFDQADTEITNDAINRCYSSDIPSVSYSPPLQIGDYFCVAYTFTSPGDQTDRNGNLHGSDISLIEAKCDKPIVNEPYGHFLGGDVKAGGGFMAGLGSCTNSASGITGFIKNPGASLTRGMASQQAALAEGPISGFGTASLRAASPYPTGQTGLMFGNANSTYGFLNSQPCTPDYYFTHTRASTVDPGANGGAIDWAGQQAYQHNGNMTIGAGSPISVEDGASIVVYVNGNLGITQSINFASADSGWADTTKIPSVYFIVSGNIYIDSSVTDIDGVYIAQKSGAAGTGIIDTCGNAALWQPIDVDSLLGLCQTPLTVNGAFISNKVRFHRAYASVRNSQSGEAPLGGAANCTENGAPGGSRDTSPGDLSYDCSAEILNYTPETFLGIPRVPQQSGPTVGKFDYITSLSPVL